MISLQELIVSSPTSETIHLTAIIDTALCIGAGGSTGSLADKPIVRTAGEKLLIPASQLKGRLRHECEKLARGLGWAICQSPKAATMCPQRFGLNEAEFRQQYPEFPEQHHCLICQMFGNPSLPSRLIFDDLICDESPENLPETIRPGVTINRRRRVAEDNKLYYLETSPPNAALEFKGAIEINPDFPDAGKPLLIAALKHINALGGSKSVGLGWLHWQWEYQQDSVIKPFINKEDWQKLLIKATNKL